MPILLTYWPLSQCKLQESLLGKHIMLHFNNIRTLDKLSKVSSVAVDIFWTTGALKKLKIKLQKMSFLRKNMREKSKFQKLPMNAIWVLKLVPMDQITKILKSDVTKEKLF